MADPVRVLHVEDDEGFAEVAGTFLEREGKHLTVEHAASGDGALERLREGGIDCVVSDYEMPGRTGIELLRAIRGEYPDLPVILFTGRGSEEVASEAISAGVTDYLQKGGGTDQYAVLANRISNAVDHTRSRRALARRNEELRRYEDMINSMQEAACIYDADGRFEVVNEYLADWYDTTRAALAGEPSNLVPYLREAFDGDPFEAMLAGERERLEGVVETEFPGHGHAVLEYRLSPLRVGEGVEGVVGVARDVTERRRRQRELERISRAMDEAPVGITITDPNREDNPIVYANERFLELTGYEESEVLGRNCRFLQGPETDPDAVADMREATDRGESVIVELDNYRKDGSTFRNRVTIAPVETDGEDPGNWVGFQEVVPESAQGG